MKKIEPMHDHVVVRRDEEIAKSAGSILIPDAARKKSNEAEVVAVGPGRITEHGQLVPTEIKVGDRVLLARWAGTEIEIGGVEHLVVRAGDIVGRVS